MPRSLHWPPRLDDPNHRRDSDPASDLPGTSVGKALVIASTERSGSSLLGSLLASTGRAGVPMEYFDEALMRAYELRTGHPRPLPRARARRTARRLVGRASWEYALDFGAPELDRYLRHLAATRTTPNGVWAIKAHWRQFERIFLAAGLEIGRLGVATFMVHLVREDEVAQACSLARAHQTGAWRTTHVLACDPPAPVYDEWLIAESLRSIRAQNHRWRRYFSSLGVTPLVVTYESLCADPEHQVDRVLDHLGEERTGPASTPLRRQADELSVEWIDRFRSERPDLVSTRLHQPVEA